MLAGGKPELKLSGWRREREKGRELVLRDNRGVRGAAGGGSGGVEAATQLN